MRFPLYAKILALLFVNLVLIAGVIFFFAQGQMRFGLDYLLAGRAGERVQATGEFEIAVGHGGVACGRTGEL